MATIWSSAPAKRSTSARARSSASIAWAPRLLSAQQVLAIGAPAIFEDYGERLLYVDGQLLDLRAAAPAPDGSLVVPTLPSSVLQTAVGIEFGWQHLECHGCGRCREDSAEHAHAA